MTRLTFLACALLMAACGGTTTDSGSAPPPAPASAASTCGGDPNGSSADLCALPGNATLGTSSTCQAGSTTNQLDTTQPSNSAGTSDLVNQEGDSGLGHTLATPVANPVSGITAAGSAAELGGVTGAIGTGAPAC